MLATEREACRPAGAANEVHRILLVGVLGWIAIQSARSSIWPLLPVIGADFGLSGAQQGAIVSVYFLLYVPMQIPAGVLGDWVGLKRVLVVMSTLAGVALVAIGLLSGSYLLLLVFIAIAGLGSGGFYPSVFGLVMSACSAERRGISSAIVTVGMSAGVALGLWISTPLARATGNWRTPIFLVAFLVFAAAIAAQLLVRNQRAALTNTAPIGDLLRDRNFILLNLVAFLFSYGSWAALTWGPTFFAAKGLELTVSAIYTSVIVLASIPSALLIGRISDLVGRKRMSLIMFPIAAATLAGMAYVNSPWLLFPILAVFGIVGNYAWNPVVVAWVADLVSASNQERMGSAIGVINFSSVAPAIIAPVVSGWLLDITDTLEIAFYLGTLLIIGAILVLLPVKETVRSTGKTTGAE